MAGAAFCAAPSDGSATQAGSVLGTPAYMPPEQAAGEVDKIDARADVFGLGATLCALLTGKPPFEGADAESVRLNAVRGRTEAAFARLDGCGADPELVALCKRCLAFEPADRPATANDVAKEVDRLRAAADERAQSAERERLASEVRATEQAKRRRVIEWAAAAVAIVLAAGTTVALWQAKVARQEAFDAELARGEAENERKKADAAREAAEIAGRQVTAQLARTAATAADLAAKRGAWEEAIRQYDTALALGADDPVRLKVARVTALMAINQLRRASAELDELSAAPDLGPLRGRVLLLQADYAMLFGRNGSTPPEEFARRARAAALSPADDAYARVFEAKTVPEALDCTAEALRHDPDHLQALNMTASLAWFVGRRAEARAAHARISFLMPGSSAAVAGGAYTAAMDGDRAEVERLTAAFAIADGKEFAAVFKLIAETLLEAQNEDALLVQPARRAATAGRAERDDRHPRRDFGCHPRRRATAEPRRRTGPSRADGRGRGGLPPRAGRDLVRQPPQGVPVQSDGRALGARAEGTAGGTGGVARKSTGRHARAGEVRSAPTGDSRVHLRRGRVAG